MQRRTASRVARSLWLLTIALPIFALLAIASHRSVSRGDVLFGLVFGSLFVVNATVGVLIASRNPGNWIGWAFPRFERPFVE